MKPEHQSFKAVEASLAAFNRLWRSRGVKHLDSAQLKSLNECTATPTPHTHQEYKLMLSFFRERLLRTLRVNLKA